MLRTAKLSNFNILLDTTGRNNLALCRVVPSDNKKTNDLHEIFSRFGPGAIGV